MLNPNRVRLVGEATGGPGEDVMAAMVEEEEGGGGWKGRGDGGLR